MKIKFSPSLASFRSILRGAVLLLAIAGCGKAVLLGGPLTPGCLRDGAYDGSAGSWPIRASVRVIVREGRVVHIDLLSHFSSWIGKKAEGPVLLRIIEQQSTRVDAVTGATNSSRVIMNAVEDAVRKARPGE